MVLTQENTRPTFVSDSLDDLLGPVRGTVELPLYLDWSPKSTYDMSRDSDRSALYVAVLSEAMSERDLTEYLNKEILLPLWSGLRLPRRVRMAWETAYPELAAC
jgi:hypothetical protein